MKKAFKSWKSILALVLAIVLVFGGVMHSRSGSLFANEDGNETAVEEYIPDVVEVPVDTVEEGPVISETQEIVLGEQTEEEENAEESVESSEAEEPEEAEENSEDEKSEEETEKTEGEETTGEVTEGEELEEAEEEIPVVLEYEDAQIKVTLSAAEGVIPEGASLKVVPITADASDSAIREQYAEVEQQLSEKAEGEDYDIIGFLAYDISFVLVDGTEVEPDGNVTVKMDYKYAVIPDDVNIDEETDVDVTVMHLEENASGVVTDVVDLGEKNTDGSVDKLKTNADSEVKKVEFTSDSFSTFTITWKSGTSLTVYAYDENKNDLGVKSIPTQNLNQTQKKASDIAPAIEGYEFVKVIRTSDWNKVNIATADDFGNHAIAYKNKKWRYNTILGSVENISAELTANNNALYYIYRSSKPVSKLKDLNGNNVSTEQYYEYAKNAVDGNLPMSWVRSTGHYDATDSKVRTNWNWSTLMKSIGDGTLTIKDPAEVWDGSRSKDGLTSKHNYTYLADDTITVYNNRMYDSATWKLDGSLSFYRFRGTFDLKSLVLDENDTYADFDYTIKSVVADVQNKIFINDNMFVFVYPTNVTLNDSNFMNYLAFWTGTSNQSGIVKFNSSNTVQGTGTACSQTSDSAFAKITDKWSADPVEDVAGGIIQNALNTGYTGTTFYVDVIANDYSSGGAMYRLKMDGAKKAKTQIEFYKVDKNDTSEGIMGARFILTDGSRSYPMTTDENGYTKVKVTPGTYTLSEEMAGGGYEKTDNKWTVKVTDKGFTITPDAGNKDANAVVGVYPAGQTNAGKYYITNNKIATGAQIFVQKKFIDESGNETSAPADLSRILVKINESDAAGYSANQNINLYYDANKQAFVGTAGVQNYTDIEVIVEKMFRADGSEIVGTWEFTDESYVRYPDATVSCKQYLSGTAVSTKTSVTVQNNEFLILSNGSKYVLVTDHASELSDTFVGSIQKACASKNSGVSGKTLEIVDSDDAGAYAGFSGKVVFTRAAAGSQVVTFTSSNTWKYIWYGEIKAGRYVVSSEVTNVIFDTKNISASKTWVDDNNSYSTRPESISLTLTGKINAGTASEQVVVSDTQTVNAASNWQYTWNGLLKRHYQMNEDGTFAKDASGNRIASEILYSVEETSVPAGYTSSVSQDGDSFTITNTIGARWNILKISENEGIDGSMLKLKGAEFKLTDSSNTIVAALVSDDNGIAVPSYTSAAGCINGTYTLEETKAPAGYVLSEETWTLTFVDGILVSINDSATNASVETSVKSDGTVSTTVTISNDVVYALPSTGGVGIYTTTIASVIMLMAGAYIIYKRRRDMLLASIDDK